MERFLLCAVCFCGGAVWRGGYGGIQNGHSRLPLDLI